MSACIVEREAFVLQKFGISFVFGVDLAAYALRLWHDNHIVRAVSYEQYASLNKRRHAFSASSHGGAKGRP